MFNKIILFLIYFNINTALKVDVSKPVVIIEEIIENTLERELICNSSPGSRIEWFFNNQSVINFPNLKQYNEKLFVKIIGYESFGVYKCHAYNSVGNSEASIEIQGHTPILVEVSKYKANYNISEDVNITCFVKKQDQTSLKITWSKDGVKLPMNAYPEENGILRIKNIQDYNTGEYLCTVIHLKSGIINSTSVRLNVIKVEKRIRPSIELYPPCDQTIKKGESTYIECRVVAGLPFPNLKWRRIDGKAFSSRISFADDDAILIIENAELEDFGAYECIATNIVGKANMAVNLVKKIPSGRTPNICDLPDVYFDENFVELYEGENHVLSCKSSLEDVSFEWFKDSISLDNRNNSQFILKSVRLEDAGNYTCRVTNEDGFALGAINVIIKKINSIRVRVSPKEQVIAINGSTEYSCSVENPNGELTYEWSKLGSKLPSNHQINSNILKINNAKPEDAGHYMCTVLSNNGTVFDVANLEISKQYPKSDFPVYIRVIEKPKFSARNPNGAFKIGSKLTIECYVKNLTLYEKPSWHRSDDGVFRPNYLIDKQNLSSIITIPAVLPFDFGKYLCNAKAFASDGSKIEGKNEISLTREYHNKFIYKIHGPQETHNFN